MSNASIPKLERIAFYLMTTNVTQLEMQGRYDACKIIQTIMREINLGTAIKSQNRDNRKKKRNQR